MPRSTQPLGELIALFLKLGTISFGGPAAHIALMEQEAVSWRQWPSRERLLDLLATTNLVAGAVAFILPAFALSLALAWVYVR